MIRGAPAPGTELAGPAIVELPESTLLIAPAGWSGRVSIATAARIMDCERSER